MKKIIVAATAAILTTSLAMGASCTTITIASGGATGNYFNVVAQNAKEALKKAGAKNVKIVQTKGTVNNLQIALNNPCTIGIGQADAIMAQMEENEAIGELSFVGDAGKEAVFVVTNYKYPDNPGKKSLLIGKEGSGTFVTSSNLLALENKWISEAKKTKKANYSASKVSSGFVVSGGIFVNAADPKNKKIKKVLDTRKLEFFPLTKENTKLGELGEGDDAIYSYVEVPLGKDKDGDIVVLPTVAVQTMFFYNPNGVDSNFEHIADQALIQVENMEKGWFEKQMSKVKDLVKKTKAQAWNLKDSLSKLAK